MAKRSKAQIEADRYRTGRPPKRPSEKMSERVMVYITKAERKRLEGIARKKSESLASLIMSPWREVD